MLKKRGQKRKVLGIMISALVIVCITTVSYSFFKLVADNSNQEKVALTTGTMELVFADNDNAVIGGEWDFGESVTKKFTLTNTGTVAASASLDWNNLINTYQNRSLSYRLLVSTTEDGSTTEVVPETNMPVTASPIRQTLCSEISVPVGTTYYYQLIITLNDLDDVEQSADIGANFHAEFIVDQPVTYRYYRLTVNTNGGKFIDNTITKEHLLKHQNTVEVEAPTRTGYTFAGWRIQGTGSAVEGTTFTMGISDTYLYAEWTPNEYTLSINRNDGSSIENKTVKYNTPTVIETPTREGYTFTGWTVTGGTFNGNEFTLTAPGNANIEATWEVNNYKYIVYHNQQNVDGNGYTLVSADTDEGEAAYNTVVTPETKTYTGFTSPAQQDLTIKAETAYPPLLNKIDYNYSRNKYNLTINPNGGTYNGKTENKIEKVYYEATYLLGTPTKTGYTFTGWTKTSGTGTLESSNYTMGDSDATVTANWNASTYSITFNANGGTVSTASKTVTYDSTYGTLPEPTYSGYLFEGWYTASSGGTQVIVSTTVKTANNHTLYAHWIKLGTDATLAKLGKTAKTGNPTFTNIATTDETAGGLYSLADDYGTSYYYRGAVTNNYVKFGKWAVGTPNAGKDMWWRIIRVNGDGSLRMIYDGTSAHANGDTNIDRIALSNISWNETNQNDAKYVGYMYGGANGVASTTKNLAQTNQTNTNIKLKLESWYSKNLTSYDEYIEDAIYCNDRSTASSTETWWTDDTKKGFGKKATAYGAFSRFVTTTNGWNTTNPNPKFVCAQENDMFTKEKQTINSKTTNGNLSQKVGLITADEIVAAGGIGGINNTSYYLYKGSWYWSISPRLLHPSVYTTVFRIGVNGNLSSIYVNDESGGVAPVISLKAEYAAQLTGSGTTSSPFQIPGVA